MLHIIRSARADDEPGSPNRTNLLTEIGFHDHID